MNRFSYLLFVACVVSLSAPATATGTARIQQADGDVKVYQNVRIIVEHKQMSITSSDGVGTLIIRKAACSAVEKLIFCLPYSATLNQHGGTKTIMIESGSAWLNPSGDKQSLPHSSTQLPPRGFLLSVRTKAGTYFSLNGVVDQLKK